MTAKFPLSLSTWDEREIKAISDVVATDRFTMGVQTAAFEREFAQFVGSRHAVMVNSGSSANLLMIDALRFVSRSPLQPGDEIIVPAVSWSTSYSPIFQCGFKLKFVDVNLETLNYDLEQLRAAISSATRAILVVNLLGNPNDFNAIQELVAGTDIRILEDNCESLGATFEGRQCGTFGLMGTFSTFYSHHICTMEGGVVVTDDDELFEILLALRAHGWTRNLPMNSLIAGVRSDDSFDESYRFILPGYNLRPVEMSGAIGREQLKKLSGFILQRRQNADAFKSVMSEFPDVMIQQEIGESSWFGFSMIVHPESERDRTWLRHALEQAGFEVRPIVAGNFLKNKALEWMNFTAPDSTPNADAVHSRGLFIGNHHVDMREVMAALGRALR